MLLCAHLSPLLLLHAGPALADEDFAYTLQPGDNPWNLSERYLIDMSYWPLLVAHNRIANDRQLPPGTTLRIPQAWLKLRSSQVRLEAVADGVEWHGGQGWQPARSGSQLQPGQRLRSSPEASATLQLADGSRLLLLGDSELRLVTAEQHAAGAFHLRIELLRGRLENAVHPMRRSGGRFEIQTPSAVTSVRGTEFRISTDELGITRTEVLDGAVELGNTAGQIDLHAGTGSLARTDHAPQPPRSLLPPPDLTHWATRWEQSSIGLRWAEQPGAVAWRLQVLALGEDGRPQGTTRVDQSLLQPVATLPALPDGHYLLRARGIDELGLEGQNAERTLQIDTQPAPPSGLVPADGQHIVGAPPTLQWQPPVTATGPTTPPPGPGGRHWRVQLARSPSGFESPWLDRKTDQPRLEPGDLPPGDWFWRVASVDFQDQGPWGEHRHFHLQLGAPVLQAAETGSHLLLRWRLSEHATPWARVQIARDPQFHEVLLQELHRGPVATLPLPQAGRYHLRLGSVPESGGEGVWGPAYELQIRWLGPRLNPQPPAASDAAPAPR